jgi:hypothetical protein
MQRLSVWARWIAAGFFTLIVIPLLVEFLKHLAENIGLYDRPREAAGAVLNFFLSLAEQTWLRVTALLLGGFVAGLWVDWFVRKVDGSRAEARKKLGAEMGRLCFEINQEVKLLGRTGVWPASLHRYGARLMSISIKAKEFCLWAPDHRIFNVEEGLPILMNYLDVVGQMLRDGHFDQAKRLALDAKRIIEREQSSQSSATANNLLQSR